MSEPSMHPVPFPASSHQIISSFEHTKKRVEDSSGFDNSSVLNDHIIALSAKVTMKIAMRADCTYISIDFTTMWRLSRRAICRFFPRETFLSTRLVMWIRRESQIPVADAIKAHSKETIVDDSEACWYVKNPSNIVSPEKETTNQRESPFTATPRNLSLKVF